MSNKLLNAMSETVIKNTDSGNNLNHNIKQEFAQECTSEKYKKNFRKDNKWSGDYRKNRRSYNSGKLSEETYFKYHFCETNPFTFEIFLKDSEIIILAINLLNVILIIGRISNQMEKERN